MACDSLGDFLTVLQDSREVIRIAAAVDPALEISAITNQVVRRSGDGGPALWFDQVRNSHWPVVTNLLGHPRRILRALRVDSLEQLASLFAEHVEHLWPRSGAGSDLSTRFAPKLVRQAACQQVVRLGKDVNLWELPALRSWPLEKNPAFTGGMLVTPDPATQQPVVSATALQLIDRHQLLPYWPTSEGPRAWAAECRKLRRQMPVAIVFGGDPALSLAGDAVPWLGEPVTYPWIGLLRRASLDVAKCRSHDLEVPADAEVVIEGFIDPDTPWEPLTDLALSTGSYAAETLVPVIQVTAITHRANPLFTAKHVGGAPSEESCRRGIIDRLFLPVVRRLSPAIVDFARPAGGNGTVTFVSVRKRQPLEARTVSHALWGCAGLRYSKLIVVVDDDVNVHREAEVWSAVARHCDPQRDFQLGAGPAHPDDHAAAIRGLGGQVAIDATRKTPAEGFPRAWPESLTFSDETLQNLATRWSELGLPERWGAGS